jgi:hypothetical protein
MNHKSEEVSRSFSSRVFLRESSCTSWLISFEPEEYERGMAWP